MKRLFKSGFFIFPLLVVAGSIAAVCVLAYYFALPQYHNHQVQNKVEDVLVSANACRAVISQEMRTVSTPQVSKSLVCDGGMSAGVKISPHLKSIAVNTAGAITVTLDFRSLPELTPATNVLTLVPLADANTILHVGDVGKPIYAWRCGGREDGTTIVDQYLPANCRG